MSDSSVPSSQDVVAYLNSRFESLGLPHRIGHLAVLPYVNPMWLANWEVPQLADVADRGIVEEEIREARWRFPQVSNDY